MAEQIKGKFSFIGRAWCRAMHDRPMWPIHGEYECSTCLRRYRVPWDSDEPVQESTPIHRVSKNLKLAA